VDRELWATFKERYAEAIDEFAILQEVIKERKPVILDGPAMSVMPKNWVEPFGIVSLLMVPLISKDEVIGLMALDHVEEGQRFTDDQVNLAITIGTHAAMAIENARLHTTIAEERAKLEGIIGGYRHRCSESGAVDEPGRPESLRCGDCARGGQAIRKGGQQ
jgi:GAF domain-containing protein